MGLFGKLFGTEKALSGIVKGVTSGLDALVYTDEEKAKDAAQSRTEARQMVVKWMESTQGQNLARRLIALSITFVWLSLWLMSVFASMLTIFISSHADNILALGQIAKGAAAEMNPAVMLILAFYFAAPHMGELSKAFIAKHNKK